MERINPTECPQDDDQPDLSYLRTALSHSNFVCSDNDVTNNESILNATSLGTVEVSLPLIEPDGGVDLLQDYARLGREDVEKMNAASPGKLYSMSSKFRLSDDGLSENPDQLNSF